MAGMENVVSITYIRGQQRGVLEPQTGDAGQDTNKDKTFHSLLPAWSPLSTPHTHTHAHTYGVSGFILHFPS